MKKSLFLLLLLSIAACLEGNSAVLPLDTMLVQLDTHLKNSKLYIDQKEKQIAKWRQELKESIDNEERYDASYRATIYSDGKDADYETNPYPVVISQKRVDANTVLQLALARGGGAAVRIEKLN